MAQDPRETWQRLQRTLQERGQQFGKGGGGGNPRQALTGLLGLVVLGGGAMVVQASLFNGEIPSS